MAITRPTPGSSSTSSHERTALSASRTSTRSRRVIATPRQRRWRPAHHHASNFSFWTAIAQTAAGIKKTLGEGSAPNGNEQNLRDLPVSRRKRRSLSTAQVARNRRRRPAIQAIAIDEGRRRSSPGRARPTVARSIVRRRRHVPPSAGRRRSEA